jgi:hypothetical protein
MEPLSGHTRRREVEEFDDICPGIHLVFSHRVYNPDERRGMRLAHHID